MNRYNNPGRRSFVLGGISLGGMVLSGCVTTSKNIKPRRTGKPRGRGRKTARKSFDPRAVAMYGAVYGERFAVPAVDLSQVDPKYYRTEVENTTGEAPGTILVDTRNFYLYFIGNNNRAMRYGVGLGRAGFEWSGRGRIAWKRKWPTWTPPADMIARQPELEKYSAENGGMAPGTRNPLGARALYIFQGNRDTLYRLHGTIEAYSIGKAVSSGCVRLLNQDVIDLYDRVPDGTPIKVI